MAKHFTSVLRIIAPNSGTPDAQTLGVEENTVILPIEQLHPSSSTAQNLTFTFDRVFQSESLTSVYKHSVKDVVESALLGYHGTVISFGTSEGACAMKKTDAFRDTSKGIIGKATEQIFRCLKKSKRSRTHTSASNLIVLCSFTIVANENVHDLLFSYSPLKAGMEPTEINLQPKEIHEVEIPPKLKVVKGSALQASQHEVKGTVKVASLLQYGTKMEAKILETYRLHNSADTAPPHHTIFTVSVEYAQFGSMNAPVSGNLTFVDVSPSDPLAHRQHYMMGEQVNQQVVSLFSFADTVNSLTTSINAEDSTGLNFDLDEKCTLTSRSLEMKQMPVTNSNLTLLISDALGGNCNTLLITHVPSYVNRDTFPGLFKALKLGSQAKTIQNNPNKRDLAEKALMSAYMRGLQEMYGQGVRAKEEELKSERARIVLTPRPPPPVELPESGKTKKNPLKILSASKDSILSEDIDTAYNEMIGMTEEEERQRNMELAATAFVAAALEDKEEEDRGGERGGGDEDEDEDGTPSTSSSSTVDQMTLTIRRKTLPSGPDTADHEVTSPDQKNLLSPSTGSLDEKQEHDVTVDTLITILQHPDKGVPRPPASALSDVHIRKDAGAVFSGASIVQWMLDNVDGIDTEEEAQALGQLLLDRGAIFHTEGSMVFVNAETLFYQARHPGPTNKALSLDEIQALLALSRRQSEPAVTTNTTIVDENQGSTPEEGGEGTNEQTNITEVEVFDGFERAPEEEMFVTHSVSNILDGGTKRVDSGLNQPFSAEENFEPELRVVATVNTACYQSPSKDNQLLEVSPMSDDPHLPLVMDGSDSNDGMENGNLTGEVENGNAFVADVDVPQPVREEWVADHVAQQAMKELLSKQDEDTGEPNTAPQENIPSIQTLENTENYPHPLHMAVAIGKSPGVVRQLVMMFGVNKKDEFNRTPIMFAALGNNKGSSCNTLIECGAELNWQDVSGLTALHVACYHGNKTAVNVLINKGASISMTDRTGHSAFHWSAVPENHGCLQLLMSYAWPDLVKLEDRSGLTAVHWAIYYDHPHHLKLLLKKFDVSLKLDSEGRTLLTYAIEQQAVKCMKVLLAAQPALLTMQDCTNAAPLHHASMQESHEQLSILLSHKLPKKSPIKLDINSKNQHDRTPLHCAVVYNRLVNASLLVEHGVLTENTLDNEGRSPMDYARRLGEEMVSVLEGKRFEGDNATVPAASPSRQSDKETGTSRVCSLV